MSQVWKEVIHDLGVYTARMKKGFTPEEKLFFLDKVGDLSDFDIIVDFGCADGTMLKCIDECLEEERRRKKVQKVSTILCGVDNNPDMRILMANTGIHARNFVYSNMKEISSELNGRNFHGRCLLILSSVLHELKQEALHELSKFVEWYHPYVVMRDMLWDYGNVEDKEVLQKLYDALPSLEQKKLEVIENLMVDEDESVSHMVGDLSTAVMYEYFLKYTYIENWETESQEWYFNNNIWTLRNLLKTFTGRYRYEITYEREYTLPYKYNQVLNDFGYKMRFPTHYQCILKPEEN